MTTRLRVGIAGLGAASAQVLPVFSELEGIELSAAADIRDAARRSFSDRYDRPAFASVAELCHQPDIDVVWIATPNTEHAEHVVMAADHGKHVICEKPIAVTLDECDRMIAAAGRSGVQILQGHSKIYDSPVRVMRDIVASERIGRVVRISTWNFNNWLQRPRLASEVDTNLGGGLVYRQGPHQIDIVRYLAGGMVRSVRATAGRHDPHFDTEGDFSAFIDFDSGATANLVLDGYGYFDTTELVWCIGEDGRTVTDPRTAPGAPRLTGPVDVAAKYSAVSGNNEPPNVEEARNQPFFGLTIVSCERGVLRQSPNGIYLYTDKGCEEIPCPPSPGRGAEFIELRDALDQGRTCFPDGRWGKATLEVCLGILRSSREQRELSMHHQVPC